MNVDQSFWEPANAELWQGDYLPDCHVPRFNPDFGRDNGTENVPVRDHDLIVVTQTCDLVNNKAPLVACCPIYTLDEFTKTNPVAKGRFWEEVRQGRREGLHLLSPFECPRPNDACRVVNFREIYSLPYPYLVDKAAGLKARWRLKSPYLEHFSQAFARFFMRVGLPTSVPAFR